MAKILLKANLKPSSFLLKKMKHRVGVSEGDKRKVIATRQLLRRKVTFFANGEREIHGVELDEQEIHDSEVLRLAHASILISAPVGDKDTCYVDATVDPVIVWVQGVPVEQYIRAHKQGITEINNV
jgi:hypothetical protein